MTRTKLAGYYNMKTNDGGQEVKEGGGEHSHIDYFLKGGNRDPAR